MEQQPVDKEGSTLPSTAVRLLKRISDVKSTEEQANVSETPAPEKNTKSRNLEVPPDVDLKTYEQNRVFPFTNYKKKEIKALKIPPRRSGYMMVCEVCSAGMGDIKSADQHISSKSHHLRLKEHQLDQKLAKVQSLSTFELDVVTKFVEDTYQSTAVRGTGQVGVRQGIVMELHKLVQQKYPNVSVQLHGSSASGFAMVTSNVNLNLDIPASLESQSVIPGIMEGVVKILNSNGTLYTDVTPDYYAFNKIPRILFKHKSSGLLCEVRAMAGNPMAVAQLLKCYWQADERALKLGVVFVHWAKVCKLDAQEFGYYPTHTFILMVIYFLQQTTPPVLPVLHELPKLKSVAMETEEKEGSLLTNEALSLFSSAVQSWHSENRQSLGELWMQLLHYYTVEFPMSRQAVSIRQHSPLLRESRQWGTHRLAVEDPMIPKNNLTRCGFFDKIFEYLMTCLKQTTVYFYTQLQNRGQRSLSKSPPPADRSGVQCEDSSIVFATSLSEATPTDTPLPSFLGESTLTPTSVEDADSAIVTTPPKSQFPDGALPVRNRKQAEEVGGKAKEEVDGLASSLSKLNISFGGFPVETTPTDTGAVTMETTNQSQGSSPSTSKLIKLKLSHVNCVLMAYPTACVVCRQTAKHTYKNCPNEALPDLSALKPPTPGTVGLRRLGELFKEHMKKMAPDSKEKKFRKDICKFILEDVKRVYPEADLQLFGSSANGFGSYTSDMDICLILPDLNPGEGQTEKQCHCEVIEKIAKELRRFVDYEQVVSITTARVPIVKFALSRWNMECDISMENRLAMRNTEMLKTYSIIDDRVRILGYAVKTFAKACDMGDASAGSLSSYAYILVMLHYLQQTTPPVVPVLQQLYSSAKIEGPIINGWNCYYFEMDNIAKLSKVWSGHRKNKQSVGELWLGFLMYVLTFNWNEQVLTIRQKEPLTKFEKWWITKPLCIEDPFNLEHNLGGNASGKMRTYILERFQDGLMYHSSDFNWQNMSQVMSEDALVGDCKAPKFLICHYCNTRGHRQSECPVRAEDRRSQPKGRGRRAPPPTHTNPPPPGRAHTYPQHGVPATAHQMSPQPHPVHPPTPQAQAHLPPTPQAHPLHLPTPQAQAQLLPTPQAQSHLPLPTPQSQAHLPSTRPPPPQHQPHSFSPPTSSPYHPQVVNQPLRYPVLAANQPIRIQPGYHLPRYQQMHSHSPTHPWQGQAYLPYSATPTSPVTASGVHAPLSPPTHGIGSSTQLPTSQGFPPGAYRHSSNK